jgi:hypothetical protein
MRKIASNGGGGAVAESCEDKLWLPTLWEIAIDEQEVGVYEDSCENAENQAELEYYDIGYVPESYDFSSRIKYNAQGAAEARYWIASPGAMGSTYFMYVVDDGNINTISGGTVPVYGIAPAFCVR